MKLKNYIQFIKESLKGEKKVWKITEQDINDYMLEITDAGYYVYIQFGFSILNDYPPNKSDHIFTQRVKPNEEVTPAYWISIHWNKHVNNDDVTSTFQFACSIIAEEANAEVIVKDSGGVLDKDAVEIKSGLFIDGDLEAEDYIAIFARSKETSILTDEDIANYYKWTDFIVKDKKVYVEVSMEDMVNMMLSRNASYKDILLNGQENMYDDYYGSDYQPDIESMFQYSLEGENSNLLVKSMIKELGGLENMINYIGDKCSDVAYESVKGKSEEEVINYLLKERFYSTLKEICKESEICQEIRQTIGDWEMHAHIDSNYQSILDEFDRIVEKEFKFTKEDKKVTKYYTTKDSEGNQIRKEYEDIETFFIIPYDNDWIDKIISEDDIFECNLLSLFNSWCDEQYFTYDMNPRFHDYGDVDRKSLNKEIKGDLERYLKN